MSDKTLYWAKVYYRNDKMFNGEASEYFSATAYMLPEDGTLRFRLPDGGDRVFAAGAWIRFEWEPLPEEPGE